MWTQDYPRADRHFVQALRRLTRLQVRSVEQPVNLDEGGVGDWPWLYAVQTGHWALTDAQAKILREYLLRGGFFMADDFWGPTEWEIFMDSMKKVFPDRQVVERVTEAGATTEQTRQLDLEFPLEVFSLSHLALPFPMNDPLYGMRPEGNDEFGVNLGAMAVRGERGALIISLDSLTRLSSNPFFPYMIDRIGGVIPAK